MGDVSDNFRRAEFACKDGCGLDAVDVELLDVLEDVRFHFGGKPLHINSGCRCAKHNASEAVGGAPDSKHVLCKAADFWIEGVDPNTVANYLDKTYPHKYGIGRYNGWTHVDVRDDRARWDSR